MGRAAGGGPWRASSGAASGPRAGEAFELEPGLRCIVAGNPGPLTLDGTRTYLLGARRPVVIDPGPAGPGCAERLVAVLAEGEVEAVCLTHAHPDHAGCAVEAAGALRAPLLAGERTLRRLSVAGRALADGEEVPVDGGQSRLRALATPGHSSDHMGYLWLPGRQLFTGDLVLGEGSSVVAHPDGSVAEYLVSLARLTALRPSRILPGHGPPVDAAAAKLEQYRRHRLERAAQVLEAVREGAASVDEVRWRVYGELPEPLARAARLSILAHLSHLREMDMRLPPALTEPLDEPSAAPPKEGG